MTRVGQERPCLEAFKFGAFALLEPYTITMTQDKALSTLSRVVAAVQAGQDVSKHLWLDGARTPDSYVMKVMSAALFVLICCASPKRSISAVRCEFKGVRGLLSSLRESLLMAISDLEEKEAEIFEARRSEWRNSTEAKLGLESLPDHLLIEIIKFTSYDEPQYRNLYQEDDLLPISKVSKRFCSLIYGTPSLWAFVSNRMTRTDIDRSFTYNKGTGLIVDTDDCMEPGCQPALDAIIERHPECVKMLTLRDVTGENMQAMARTMSFLRVVTLFADIAYDVEGVEDIWAECSFPSLSSADISYVVPPPHFVENVTKLRLKHLSPRGMGLLRVVSVLRSAPFLQDFELVLDENALVNTDGTDWLEQNPAVIELPRLEHLRLTVSWRRESAKSVLRAVAWLTRALKAPILSSFDVSFAHIEPMGLDQNFDLQFFRTDAPLHLVENVYLHVHLGGIEEHQPAIRDDTLKIARCILSRLPCIKRAELDLQAFAYPPLIDIVSMLPSLRFLSMNQNNPLEAAELTDLIDWLRRLGHHSDRLYLLTSAEDPTSLIKRIDDDFGRTSLKWEDLV